jgi:hypothetical protein
MLAMLLVVITAFGSVYPVVRANAANPRLGSHAGIAATNSRRYHGSAGRKNDNRLDDAGSIPDAYNHACPNYRRQRKTHAARLTTKAKATLQSSA